MKRVTWTIEPAGDVKSLVVRPDDDVEMAVAEFLKKNSGYDRSKIINEALRLRLPEAIASLLRQEVAKIQAQLTALDRAKKDQSFNSLKKAKSAVVRAALRRARELSSQDKRQ